MRASLLRERLQRSAPQATAKVASKREAARGPLERGPMLVEGLLKLFKVFCAGKQLKGRRVSVAPINEMVQRGTAQRIGLGRCLLLQPALQGRQRQQRMRA